MTKQDEFDFTQFKGSFDSGMSPDSDFTERMKQMLDRESGAVDPQRRTTVIASPSRSNKDVPVPSRRTHPLTIAASILLVFAVVASSIWVLSDVSLEGEYGSAPSGIATLPADAEVTPGPDVALQTHLLTKTNSQPYVLGVFEDIALISHWVDSDNEFGIANLMAVDRNTGESLWVHEDFNLENVTYDGGGTFVGFLRTFDTESSPGFGTSSLVALDATTGEVRWEQDLPESEHPEIPIERTNPAIVNNLVVVAMAPGIISAWNIDTGELVWENDIDLGTGRSNEITISTEQETIRATTYTFVMTIWNDQIAVANGDGLVQMIDPTNGETMASHQLGGFTPGGSMSLQSLPGGLLYTRFDEGYILTAFDPDSGNVFWEREIEGDLSVDVAGNGMVAVNSHIWESGNFIMRLLGRGGQSTHQFHWIDGATGEDVLVTDRGRTDGPVFAVTNGEYLCTRNEEFVCYDRVGTRHTVENGPWAQAFFEDGNLYFDRDDGVYRVDLP